VSKLPESAISRPFRFMGSETTGRHRHRRDHRAQGKGLDVAQNRDAVMGRRSWQRARRWKAFCQAWVRST
jgi:hypothetical protein